MPAHQGRFVAYFRVGQAGQVRPRPRSAARGYRELLERGPVVPRRRAAGTAPDDYKKPDQFFARNWFTRALREHAGMVLRRLSGRTENTAPVLTLITQFGGGKTHTLTTLYHLASNGEAAAGYPGVADLVGG
jgi:hypothetical protein